MKELTIIQVMADSNKIVLENIALKKNLIIFKQRLETADLSDEQAVYELMELMQLFDKLFKGKI
jgi:hypothetical protein